MGIGVGMGCLGRLFLTAEIEDVSLNQVISIA